ncbi:MAG TPA: hypothetical protein VF494_06765 [Candidatus Limnocylindrales bacterium]
MSRGRPALAATLARSSSLGLAVLLFAGCSALRGQAPEPTPLDFGGIAGQIALQGIAVDRPISGDAGCQDPTLIAPAVGLDVSGLGVASPLRARIYIFGDKAAYDRRRPAVDACVAAWATDPGTVEFVDASPFVLAIQGPVPAPFKSALVRALTTAARGTN